ncbi:MAG: hypothetical protein AAF649_11070 [Verrucomicrobiota bacterium]
MLVQFSAGFEAGWNVGSAAFLGDPDSSPTSLTLKFFRNDDCPFFGAGFFSLALDLREKKLPNLDPGSGLGACAFADPGSGFSSDVGFSSAISESVTTYLIT